MPEKITWTDGRRIEWLYDANGAKLKKTVFAANETADYVQDYVNGFVYRTDFTDALPGLSYFSFNEGRVVKTGSTFDYHYFLKDHLGNVRVVFSGINGEVKENNFYYPFGITKNIGSIVGDENEFKYNNKEYEDDHGLNWYHYGARYYDPVLGRWHTMDPADEFHSPYVYVGNNPINFIDPDGTQAVETFEKMNKSIRWGEKVGNRYWEKLGNQWFSGVDVVEISPGNFLVETHVYNSSGKEMAILKNGEFIEKHLQKGSKYLDNIAKIPEDILKNINGVSIKHMSNVGLIEKGSSINNFFKGIKNTWSKASGLINEGISKLNSFFIQLDFVPTGIIEYYLKEQNLDYWYMEEL